MEYRTQICNHKQYQLAVVGGGMTGVCAAIAAARQGISTVLIEQQGCLGGVATSAGVCHLLGGRKYSEKLGRYCVAVGGLFEEITNQMVKEGHAIHPNSIDRSHNPHGWFSGLAEGVPFELEYMKHCLEKLCLDAGVQLLYFTRLIDVLVQERQIHGLVCHNKSGLMIIQAQRYIDATGDADLASLAGCPMLTGREGDGMMAPASLEMHLEQVDKAAFLDFLATEDGPRCRKLIQQLRQQGEWPFPYEIFIAVQLNQPDVFFINTIRQVGINGSDGESLTHGMVAGRDEALQLLSVLQRHFPGFAHARLRLIAPMIGIRETRRIDGTYRLTVAQVLSKPIFEDSIAITAYGWDLPDPQKPSVQPMHELKQRPPIFTEIPYRCLLPQGIDNLLAVGRCISVERDVLGPVRVMAPCCAMGQAAGLAMAVSLETQTFPGNISIKKLHDLQHQENCIIHMPADELAALVD